jgi:hypothetical protein
MAAIRADRTPAFVLGSLAEGPRRSLVEGESELSSPLHHGASRRDPLPETSSGRNWIDGGRVARREHCGLRFAVTRPPRTTRVEKRLAAFRH